MTRSKPFMCYLDEAQHQRLRKFANKSKLPMTQIIREGIDARIAEKNPYFHGFNEGVKQAIAAVSSNKASQMRFPSGKSFGDLIIDDLNNILLKDTNHGEREITADPHEA